MTNVFLISLPAFYLKTKVVGPIIFLNTTNVKLRLFVLLVTTSSNPEHSVLLDTL